MKKTVIKKRGKIRTIYVPNKNEKYILKDLALRLMWLYYQDLPNSVHGFVYGRNAVTNAAAHVNQDFTITFDLENFFDSIKKSHLKMIRGDVLKKTLIDGAPRQGLPTSPILSNFALLFFDKWAETLPVIYTRYADDITISGNSLEELLKIKKEMEEMLNANGFRINAKKTKVMSSKAGRRVITGISVSNDIRPSRKTRRKLRAALHQGNTAQADGLKQWAMCNFPLECPWVLSGTFDNPTIRIVFKNFQTGLTKPTTTFKGSRAVFYKHIRKKI